MNDTFDALIIGSGAAGLYTALCFTDRFRDEPHRRIGLVTKSSLQSSASCWAQGGIAAVLDPDDSLDLHLQDTLKAGVGLCDPDAVEILVREAPRHIHNLLKLGVNFDRTPSGSLALTLEAAHSRHRVLHAADATGKALVETLTDRVLAHPQIAVLAETQVLELIIQGGRCCGVVVELSDGSSRIFKTAVTVLATGGGAYVYSQTTNPPTSTGEGVVMAWRSGVVVRDMEFVQFHPTALCLEGAPRFLISEAVRGEGAHLVDDTGYRFAFDYHPQGELAPRDIVSRAIWQHLHKTGANCVFLDLSPIPLNQIRHRFPTIGRICQEWQIDIEQQPIPVTPAAHYCIGGIATDTKGETSIVGLYAVGEAASTGVHGANRLASNSLLECFVFGERLARLCTLGDFADLSQIEIKSPQPVTNAYPDRVRQICWESAGIMRSQESLDNGLAQLHHLEQSQTPDRATKYLIDYGRLIMKAALYRSESRGTHYRQDYPEPKSQWQRHTSIVLEKYY